MRGKKLKKKVKKKKLFLNQKMLFHYFFFLSISRVGPFSFFENSILVRKNKTWLPNFQKNENLQFFFKNNHNSSAKIGHTFDEQNVKNELFSKIKISSFTLRFWSKMKFYSKIIGSTLLIFSIFVIIRTDKESYQGSKQVVKNRKIGLIFYEKKGGKKLNFFGYQDFKFGPKNCYKKHYE
jgi:hypothetical protein